METVEQIVRDKKAEQERMEIVREKKEEQELMEQYIANREEQEALQKIDPQEKEEIAHKINDAGINRILLQTLYSLRKARPDERSERSRRYAVTITEMEKVVAYFKMWVIGK